MPDGFQEHGHLFRRVDIQLPQDDGGKQGDDDIDDSEEKEEEPHQRGVRRVQCGQSQSRGGEDDSHKTVEYIEQAEHGPLAVRCSDIVQDLEMGGVKYRSQEKADDAEDDRHDRVRRHRGKIHGQGSGDEKGDGYQLPAFEPAQEICPQEIGDHGGHPEHAVELSQTEMCQSEPVLHKLIVDALHEDEAVHCIVGACQYKNHKDVDFL